MGEHLAGSTHRILIGVFFLLSAACSCVRICLCVYAASVYYLHFCLITFLTIGFDYSKRTIHVTYLRYFESFLKI